MAKSNAELKALTDSVNKLTETVNEMGHKLQTMTLANSKAYASLEELNHVVQNISVKLDCLNNDVGVVGSSDASLKPKRVPTKKKAQTETKEAAVVDVSTNATDEGHTANANNALTAPPVKKPVRKTPTKKVIEEPQTEEVKEPVATTPQQQPETKTAPRKAKAAAPARQINKMEFFKQQYTEDNTYFDEYLTDEVKATIRKANKDAWATLSADALLVEERKAFYNYMKDTYDKELQSMKTDWINEQANASVKIVGKE